MNKLSLLPLLRACLVIVLAGAAPVLVSAQSPLPFGTTAQPGGGIVLRNGWDSALSDGIATMKELKDLLSGFASPAANIAPNPNLEIYRGVTYLMPLAQAVNVLGLKQLVNGKVGIVCPGFPRHSLSAYAFDGSFEDGFNKIYLVTDLTNQVVAVEFVNASTEKVNIHPRREKKEWVTYDFVNTRIKGQVDAKVRHETTVMNGSIQIDSIFVNPVTHSSFGPYSYSAASREMHPTRIYISRPLAELILFRINKSGN